MRQIPPRFRIEDAKVGLEWLKRVLQRKRSQEDMRVRSRSNNKSSNRREERA